MRSVLVLRAGQPPGMCFMDARNLLKYPLNLNLILRTGTPRFLLPVPVPAVPFGKKVVATQFSVGNSGSGISPKPGSFWIHPSSELHQNVTYSPNNISEPNRKGKNPCSRFAHFPDTLGDAR